MPAAVKGDSQPQLSKEVKDALADEVKEQIAADKSAAENPKKASGSSGHALATPAVILLPLMFAASGGGDTEEMPPALYPEFRYFVVATDLDLSPAVDKECPLTQGDVIYATSDQPDENNNVDVIVKSSKKDDCAVGTKGPVDANDLQEMYNQFRVSLEAGLKSLAEKPERTDSSSSGYPHYRGRSPGAYPRHHVDSDLQQQQKDADQTGSGGQTRLRRAVIPASPSCAVGLTGRA